MKVRKVIGRGRVAKDVRDNRNDSELYLAHTDIDYADLPPGTEIEIAALVEPERKLIRPEGARWVRDIDNKSTKLLIGEELVATVWSRSGYGWTWRHKARYGDLRGYHSNPNAATIECEECLADEGLYGFRWECEEPERVCWRTFWRCSGGTHDGCHYVLRKSAYDDYDKMKCDSKFLEVKLYGITADGESHELDRWPKED